VKEENKDSFFSEKNEEIFEWKYLVSFLSGGLNNGCLNWIAPVNGNTTATKY
jgi:hypothetical protein